MADNYFSLFGIQACKLKRFAGYKHVAGSVKTIAADAVFLIIFIGNGIEIRLFRHCHTKSSIPYGHVRRSRHCFFAGLDSHQVGRIVKRSQIKAFPDDTFYILIYYDGLTVNGSCVKNPMSHGGDLFCIRDYTILRIYQCFHNQGNGFRMLGHGLLNHQLLVGRLVGQLGTFNSDSLTEAFRHYVLVVHINELIFQGRTSAVQYQYFHV